MCIFHRLVNQNPSLFIWHMKHSRPLFATPLGLFSLEVMVNSLRNHNFGHIWEATLSEGNSRILLYIYSEKMKRKVFRAEEKSWCFYYEIVYFLQSKRFFGAIMTCDFFFFSVSLFSEDLVLTNIISSFGIRLFMICTS